MQKKSLLERIKSAKTIAEINQLLGEGAKFEKATYRTKNRWGRAALIRVKSGDLE